MQIKSLLAGVVNEALPVDLDVTGMTVDSNAVVPGDLFIALAGSNSHGIAFLHDALARGAVAVLMEGTDGINVPECERPIYSVMELRAKLGVVAGRLYPSSAKIIGITGTDGKTSTSHIIASLLTALYRPCGVLGTLGYGVDEKLTPLNNTTPDVVSVHRFLAKMANDGAQFIAMEVSSHGLVQQRVNGVDFSAAVLTNLGHEHLDYHGSRREYAAAKKKLFHCGAQIHILNIDDQFGQQLSRELDSHQVMTYGMHGRADVEAKNIQLTAQGTHFTLCYADKQVDCQLQLVGMFNVYNTLAAAAVLISQGIDIDDISAALPAVKPVPGRMERHVNAGMPVVIIDFAHTPDALESALQTVKSFASHNVAVVFGCGGDRDHEKRPKMAEIAEKYADQVVVTDDNPRYEKSLEILADINKGFRYPNKVTTIADRKSAIHHALRNAQQDAVVLIAGKGHETYQDIAGVKMPYSDQAVLREYAEALQ